MFTDGLLIFLYNNLRVFLNRLGSDSKSDNIQYPSLLWNGKNWKREEINTVFAKKNNWKLLKIKLLISNKNEIIFWK